MIVPGQLGFINPSGVIPESFDDWNEFETDTSSVSKGGGTATLTAAALFGLAGVDKGLGRVDPATDTISWEADVALDDVTDNSFVTFGFTDSMGWYSTPGYENGIMFVFQPGFTTWLVETMIDGNFAESYDTGITVSASTIYRLKVEITGGDAFYYIDGVLVRTVSNPVLLPTVPLGPMAQIQIYYGGTGPVVMTCTDAVLTPSNGPDIGAAEYFATVLSNGGTIGSTAQDAYETFIVNGRTWGWWRRMRFILPMLGDFTAMKIAHSLGLGTATPTFDNFVSGDWTEATGLIGDGSTKKINFGFRAPVPTGGLSAYPRVAPAGATNQAYLGAQDGSNAFRIGRTSSNADDSMHYGGLTAGPTVTVASRSGFFHGHRQTNVLAQLWRNGVQIGADYTVSTTPAEAAFNIYGFANNSSGTAGNYLHSTCRMCYFAVDDGEWVDYALYQVAAYGLAGLALQTALSRN